MKHTITVIGSGNWGTAISKLIAENIKDKPDFEDQLNMYTHEEIIDGKKLSHIINTENENIKYLPKIKLPKNLKSITDLKLCIENSDVIVFVLPHQFIEKTVHAISTFALKKDCFAVSLIKGITIDNNNQIILISEYIKRELNIDCGVLMGANIASQVAEGCISEGTLACSNDRQMRVFMNMFNCYTYRVSYVTDIVSVELCGTLKNIVSIAYGIACGLNYPSNTKVAILRNGFKEIINFCQMFFEGVRIETFFESSGIADLFVSALSGRNSKYGEMLVEGMDISSVEKKINDQKLQGPSTAKDIFAFLEFKGKTCEFPFFTMVYRICYGNEPCDSILEVISFKS